MNPPIYLATSDQTMKILPAQIYCLNKYWPNQTVYILGYKEPDFDLPENFFYNSLGEDPGPSQWSNAIIEYIETTAPGYFIFSTDDMLPIKPVDDKMVKWLVNKYCNKSLGRICLWNDVQKRMCHPVTNTYPYDYNIVKAGNSAAYRVSIVWSIWNKNAFLEALKPSMSPWQFEKHGTYNSKLEIIGTRGHYPIHCSHGLFSNNIPQHNWEKCICDCGLHVSMQTRADLQKLLP